MKEPALTEFALTEPAERGSLTIADRVVARVAGYAVTQVEHATAAPRRVLGLNIGDPRPEDGAHVDATVSGETATVTATIAVAWPSSVHEVAAETRRRVREEVTRITEVTVDYVDIDVVSMKTATRPTPRVR